MSSSSSITQVDVDKLIEALEAGMYGGIPSYARGMLKLLRKLDMKSAGEPLNFGFSNYGMPDKMFVNSATYSSLSKMLKPKLSK